VTAKYFQPDLILKAMFSLKPLAGLLAGSFLAVSCTPVPPIDQPPPLQPAGPVANPNAPEALPSAPKTPEQIEKEKNARRKREQEIAAEQEKNERVEPVQPGNRTEIKPPAGSYPTAQFVRDSAGKPVPGLVYNPYTGNPVDVKGIPSGTKIRDPKDGNPKHLFFVP
jgi:hypothetical protein